MVATTQRWEDLPEPVRRAVEARIGHVRIARTAAAGVNAAVTTSLHTAEGDYFLKGVPRDHPGIRAHRKEAILNPYVAHLAPRLLWRIDPAEWSLLGFEHLQARRADYSPGSPDLEHLARTIAATAAVPPPDLAFIPLTERFRHIATDAETRHLVGDTFLHTDLNANNLLIDAGRCYVVDWAMATTGPAWCELAFIVPRLMQFGHTTADAEAWLARFRVWREAPTQQVDAFATVIARAWTQLAARDPQPYRTHMAAIATTWHRHRTAERAESNTDIATHHQ